MNQKLKYKNNSEKISQDIMTQLEEINNNHLRRKKFLLRNVVCRKESKGDDNE
jgi:hypothetical protein